VLPFVGAGVALLVAFAVAESRQRSPMMPLTLFRSRAFSGANLLTLLLYAALGGAMFFIPFDLVQVQGASPAAAGAMLLPLVVLLSALSPWTGNLVARRGARLFLIAGPAIAGVGLGLLAIPGAGGAYWLTFLPGMVVLGLGMGFTVAPLTTTVMQSADRHHAGVASGINNAVARAAGLLAVAAFGVLLRAQFNATLDSTLGSMGLDASTAQRVDAQRAMLVGADFSWIGDEGKRSALHAAFAGAYVAGFRATMLLGAVLAVLASAVAFASMPRSRAPTN
jgi:predicted MFS family arabinose efflux permease